ncbi:MAG: hypothetical protein AABY15_06220 [Nanoarchaeota archaeon]
MLAEYEDIKKRIKEEPKWYDENGTPRYDSFHPELSPNIYADEVALMKISCQECGQIFYVEMSWSKSNLYNVLPLSKNIKSLHYGDPPRHSNCSAGDTMNCNDLEIVEFWERNFKKSVEWVRNKKFEIKLD